VKRRPLYIVAERHGLEAPHFEVKFPRSNITARIETTRGTKLHTIQPNHPAKKHFLSVQNSPADVVRGLPKDSLAELALLVDTADIDVVGQMH
jgi:hypothetical protein